MSAKNLAKLVNMALEVNPELLSSTYRKYRDNFFAKSSRPNDKSLSRSWTNIPLIIYLIVSLYRYYTGRDKLDKMDLALAAFCILGWVTMV